MHRISFSLYATMILLSVLIYSCKKNNLKRISSGLQSGLKTPEIPRFSMRAGHYSDPKNINGILSKSKLNDAATFDNRNPWTTSSVKPDGPGRVTNGFDLTGKEDPNKVSYLQAFKSNVFVIADNQMSLNIFPGAIIDGGSISANGYYEPQMQKGIENNKRPVTVSTSIPVSPDNTVRTFWPRPSNDRAFQRQALSELERLYPGETGISRLQVEIDTFSVYEELKTLYGYNKNIGLFIANYGKNSTENTHTIATSSAIKIKFYQEHFYMDVDGNLPAQGELIDFNGLDQSVFGGTEPCYVSRVAYGRMGIMLIESTSSASALYNAVNKQVQILEGVVGVGTHLTAEEESVINQAKIRVKFTGLGTDKDKPTDVFGVAGFIETLSANASYDKDHPGIAISYQLKTIRGDKLIEAPFDINYGSYDKPYARIEYRNIQRSNEKFSSTSFLDQIKADLVIACYSSPLCTPESEFQAPNFISFNYKIISNNYTYDPQGHSPDDEDNKYTMNYSTNNKQKTKPLFLNRADPYLRYYGSYLNPKISKYESQAWLLDGTGYFLADKSGSPYGWTLQL